MTNNKLVTISIGIPVHNESENITYLLRSILRQKAENYVLEKIYIMCDGTTDGTDKVANKIAKKDQRVVVLNDHKQKGKMERLMEIYKTNTSQYIALFDGDVVLGQENVLNNMVKKFNNKNVVIVGANNQPLPASTFVGRLINRWSEIWYNIRKNYNNGNNIHNIRGCCIMLEKKFAKTIKFKKGLISDAQYIYVHAYINKLTFVFTEDALVYYRKPSTIFDYLLQSKRNIEGGKRLEDIFGEWVIDLYKIPDNYKYKVLTKQFLFNPIDTIAAFAFTYAIKFIPYKPITNNNKGLWKRVHTTKKGISMITF